MAAQKGKKADAPEGGSLSYGEAVSAVINAPPLPEQQAKKEAAKARREVRKRQGRQAGSKPRKSRKR